MSRMMQYSFYVRMLIEEFVSIFITCLINVMRPKYTTWGEILSFIVAIILIVSYYKMTYFRFYHYLCLYFWLYTSCKKSKQKKNVKN
jgi:hypothetical protein